MWKFALNYVSCLLWISIKSVLPKTISIVFGFIHWFPIIAKSLKQLYEIHVETCLSQEVC